MNATEGAMRELQNGYRSRVIGDAARDFSHAAEALHMATRLWVTIPPATAAETESASNQIEGLRRALIDIRTGLPK